MFSCESRMVAFGRNESQLELAAEFGADATINIEHKKKEDERDEINNVTNGKGLNVVLDCVGLENTADLGITLFAKEGNYGDYRSIWKGDQDPCICIYI
jgi:alcohol dehydrogenase, propanol-preferring